MPKRGLLKIGVLMSPHNASAPAIDACAKTITSPSNSLW